MKRVLYVLVCLSFLSTTLNAQKITDESKGEKKDSVRNIKEYAGTYLFEANGDEAEAVVEVISDSVLYITAYMGEAYIKRNKKDNFSLTEYSGTIEFFADELNKIKGLRATINDAGLFNVEARKKDKEK